MTDIVERLRSSASLCVTGVNICSFDFAEELRDAAAAIESLRAVQRWISVKDELPKDDVAVLCACFGKSGVPLFYAAAKYFRNGYYGKNYWIDEDCIINHPTHWIRIPTYTQDTK